MRAAGAALLLLAACDPEPWGPAAELRIRVEGRLERSLTVRVELLRDGAPVQQERVRWSVDPPEMAEVSSPGELRMREAGSAVLAARYGDRLVRRTLEVAAPPRVVFDMEAEDRPSRDVFSVALDGRGLRRLAGSPATDADPTVAGPRVVFVSHRDGNGELYSVPEEGGEGVRLTTTPGPEGEPALSPDGTRLAFTRPVGGIPKLWTAAADGSGAVRRTAGFGSAGTVEADPSWATSSRSVVFMATVGAGADLYRWSATSGVEPVLREEGPDLEPAWGPDGRSVAFAADRGDGADLHLLRLDSREVVRLTARPENEGQPAWTGDGRIVYTVFGEEGSELWWLDPADRADGGPVRIPLPGRSPENPAARK